MKFYELAKTRRQHRVEALLRPGLRGQKRKAASVLDLADELRRSVLNTIEAKEKVSKNEKQIPRRRDRLKLRTGLNRVIPFCTVTNLDFENRTICELDAGVKLRDSNWTSIEGVPERWMQIQQQNTNSEFRFTPVEGVLERMIAIHKASPLSHSTPSWRRSPQRTVSMCTDIEGIPERHCVFPVSPVQQNEPCRTGTPVQTPIRTGHSIGVNQEIEAMSESHTGMSSFGLSPQGPELVEEEQEDLAQSVLLNERGSVLKTYAHEIHIPAIEILDSPANSQARISQSVISISDQDEEIEDCISIDGDMEFKSNARSHKKSMSRRTEDSGRNSLLGSDVGMRWVNGCRRSQRNKCKPLRWWEGEQKVYGRDYNTLATVTGYVTKKNPEPEWPRRQTTTRKKRTRP
eukprot:g2805.t1